MLLGSNFRLILQILGEDFQIMKLLLNEQSVSFERIYCFDYEQKEFLIINFHVKFWLFLAEFRLLQHM